MTIYLLDVNVLLALADPMHMHHGIAHDWFYATGKHAWATCPLTENGFVRVGSHPKYPNRPGDTAVLLSMLHQFCEHAGHHFWPDAITLRNLLHPNAVMTHNHITDIYLLGLALFNNGKLATLDKRIPATVIEGGAVGLEILS